MKAILIARVSTEEHPAVAHKAMMDEQLKFDRIIDLILQQREKVAVCCNKVDRLSRNVFYVFQCI